MFKFMKDDADTKRMAIFVSQLIKEAVVFTVRDLDDRIEITLTGGF